MKTKEGEMNKRAKTILAYISLFVVIIVGIVFLANAVIAYTSGTSAISINYNLVTQDMAGRHYTPACFGTCDLVFSLSYSGSSAPISVNIDSNKLQTQFSWFKGQDKFQNSEIYYLREYQEEATDYSTVCLPYTETDPINGTITEYPNCTQVAGGSHLETRQDWQELSSLTLEKGKTYYIDIRGYFKPSLEGFAVDVIPRIMISDKEFVMTEMAWWNSSVSYKRLLTFNNTVASKVKMPYIINGTDGVNGSIIWTFPEEAFNATTNYSEYLYYNNFNAVYVVNFSENFSLPHESEDSRVNSYNPYQVWQANYIPGIWHLNSSNNSAGSGNHITWSTAPTFKLAKFNYGVFLDGGTYGNIPNDAPFHNANHTRCVWVNLSVVTATLQYIVGDFDDTGGSALVYGLAAAFGYIVQGDAGYTGSGTTTALANQLYFVCMAYGTDRNVSLYVNGTMEKLVTLASDMVAGASVTRIGARVSNGANKLQNGIVDEYIYWNRTLIDDEIKAIYEQAVYKRSELGLNLTVPSQNATESQGDSAILTGIGNSTINSSYSTYSDQQVYIRNVTGQQQLGRFDVVASSGNQRWAFNYITSNDSTSGFTYMVNMTPVLYVWESVNLTALQISEHVKAFINSTKQ